jgi:hypothetical protein
VRADEIHVMRRLLVVVTALAIAGTMGATSASADQPSRERQLTCTDGTVFTAEQVRNGQGRPPRIWRNVLPDAYPAALTYHALTLTAPDGAVVDSETWDQSQGVERNHELVTCGFVIPVGPLTDHEVELVGFFLG